MNRKDEQPSDIAEAVREIIRDGSRRDSQSDRAERDKQLLRAYQRDVSKRCLKYLRSTRQRLNTNMSLGADVCPYPNSFMYSLLGLGCRSVVQGDDSSAFLSLIALLLSDYSGNFITAADWTSPDAWKRWFSAGEGKQTCICPGVPVLVEAEMLTGTILNLLLQSMDLESFQGILLSRSAPLQSLYGMDLQILRQLLTHREDVVLLISDADKINEQYREQFFSRLSSFLQRVPWRVLISCKQADLEGLLGFEVVTQDDF